jgi:predicted nucleic acid-binding protein
MKISLDTSIIVEIERRNEKIRGFIESLLERHEIFISVVVPSEVFTGTYLRIDYEKATQKAKGLFSKFEIIPLNMEIAEIIATFIYKMGDYLLTKNNKHFVRIPELIDRVLTPDEADRIM